MWHTNVAIGTTSSQRGAPWQVGRIESSRQRGRPLRPRLACNTVSAHVEAPRPDSRFTTSARANGGTGRS
jgi:hypothetical protein